MNLRPFEEILGYVFHKTSLLEMALTHRSYAFEHGPNHDNNQRLEFLGDAILDFVIADVLYEQYPDFQEGELSRLRSRLVCEAALSQLAHRLEFEKYILMGKGEISVSGMMRPGTLADAYEAVIGAVYLDGGIDNARSFILNHHAEFLHDLDGNWLARDAKTRLQEKAQADHHELRYEVVSETGPSHAPTFEVVVFMDETCIGRGTGHNKKEAQQAAAENALDSWGNHSDNFA